MAANESGLETHEAALFSLETVYACGEEYQPLIRRLEAAGRAGIEYRLNQHEKNALMQNIRDVLTHSYYEAVNGCVPNVLALRRQAQLGRWRYLDQLPREAAMTFRQAFARFHITIGPRC